MARAWGSERQGFLRSFSTAPWSRKRKGPGGPPEKGRKRRRAPNRLVEAAEAMRARWDLEERQPDAKLADLKTKINASGDIERINKTNEAVKYGATMKTTANLQNDPIIQKYGFKRVGLNRCILKKEEMKAYHFPLHRFSDYENFVPTKCNGSITDNRHPSLGLDCEMEKTISPEDFH
ncbi:RNA exonuclease 5 [Rhynchocyon petersi]